MIPDMVEVSPVLANKARTNGAEAWLAALPELVAELSVDWQLTIGPAFADGTEAWVGAAVAADGRPAVLKVGLPRSGPDPLAQVRREAAVLARTAGRGCVELLRWDVDRGAMLLERLGPSLADLAVSDPDSSDPNRSDRARQEILAQVARRFWRPAAGMDLPSGAEKARWLIGFIETTWEQLDRPCSAAAVDLALAAAESRADAHDEERSVLVHGDIHQWNVLRADAGAVEGAGAGWKLIDPDGLVAEPAYDLGVILREDPEELLIDIAVGDPRRRARALSAWTGVEVEAIWDWALVERVSTGLLAVQIDLQPVGGHMLEAADRLAERGD